MWKFRQTPPGGSIKSISGHALPISYSMWEDSILGMSPMLNSEALRPLKLNPVHSPALLTVESSHSLTHACPWLMGLMSDAGMCSDQWARLTQGSTGSCQVIQQGPICIKQIQDSRLPQKELTICVIRKQTHFSCGCRGCPSSHV